MNGRDLIGTTTNPPSDGRYGNPNALVGGHSTLSPFKPEAVTMKVVTLNADITSGSPPLTPQVDPESVRGLAEI